MALILMDGFDADDAVFKWYNGQSAGSTTATRYSTGRAITITNTAVTRSFTASSQIFVGLILKTSNIDTVVRPYFVLYGDNGATAHLSIGYANNTLNLYRGALSTVIASYSTTFVANTWYAIEVSATIADAGGTCEVKLDNVTVINFTGDTKNGGTNTTFDVIGLGSNGGYTAYFDDFYICNSTGSAPHNTFLGEIRIRPLSPSGAGTSTQFTPSSGANYAAVDELPSSSTDYVSSGTVGQLDTYAMANIGISNGTILAVQNNVIAKKTDTPSASIKTAVRSGGSVYYGATTPLLGSDQKVSDILSVDPATSAAWTISGVDNLEAGFEVA